MTNNIAQSKNKRSLQKVLESNLNTLIAANADKALVDQYLTLLSVVKRYGLEGLEDRLEGKKRRPPHEAQHKLPDNFVTMSLDELLSLVSDEMLPRKGLEQIAIDRFGVPSGSMRSFSNRRMLVDKLRSLIRNEYAHATIGNLARHDSRSDESK
jgi:hypothetical protein